MVKIINVKIPQNEAEFVNLFSNVIETFRTSGEELPLYFSEPNICDDCEIEEIIELLNGYYLSETEKQIRFLGKRESNYLIEVTLLNFGFFKTTMPKTRSADFYLGCLDGSVFLDFNLSDENLILLRRISFDGYGCCNIEAPSSNPLNYESSQKFLAEIKKDKLNQENLTMLVKEIIRINMNYIWTDALEKYGLLDKT
jgi:hypothetical protein